MLWNAALSAGLLAATASASGALTSSPHNPPPQPIKLRAADVLTKRYADVSSGFHLHKRQRQSFESTVTLNPDGTIDLEAWDEETEAACQSALKRLQIATNPSGTCICYNLPSLDTASGVFEADLRVYKFNEPSGPFAGIAPENIQVLLMYDGASVSPVTAEDMRNMPRGLERRQDAGGEEEDPDSRADLPLLQQYLLVGQIDESRMSDDISMAQLEALVMPVLTLSAQNSTGQTVNTTVSSNEAVFVTGVFSQEVVMSDFARANEAVEVTVALLEQKKVAFVLPGIQLMVYPIGLIITSVWLVLGVIAYGIGTYDRIRYAESYRRRLARATSTSKPI